MWINGVIYGKSMSLCNDVQVVLLKSQALKNLNRVIAWESLRERAWAHHPGSWKVKNFVSIDVLYTIRTVWSVAFWGCVSLNTFMEGKKSYSIFYDF